MDTWTASRSRKTMSNFFLNNQYRIINGYRSLLKTWKKKKIDRRRGQTLSDDTTNISSINLETTK